MKSNRFPQLVFSYFVNIQANPNNYNAEGMTPLIRAMSFADPFLSFGLVGQAALVHTEKCFWASARRPKKEEGKKEKKGLELRLRFEFEI